MEVIDVLVCRDKGVRPEYLRILVYFCRNIPET